MEQSVELHSKSQNLDVSSSGGETIDSRSQLSVDDFKALQKELLISKATNHVLQTKLEKVVDEINPAVTISSQLLLQTATGAGNLFKNWGKKASSSLKGNREERVLKVQEGSEVEALRSQVQSFQKLVETLIEEHDEAIRQLENLHETKEKALADALKEAHLQNKSFSNHSGTGICVQTDHSKVDSSTEAFRSTLIQNLCQRINVKDLLIFLQKKRNTQDESTSDSTASAKGSENGEHDESVSTFSNMDVSEGSAIGLQEYMTKILENTFADPTICFHWPNSDENNTLTQNLLNEKKTQERLLTKIQNQQTEQYQLRDINERQARQLMQLNLELNEYKNEVETYDRKASSKRGSDSCVIQNLQAEINNLQAKLDEESDTIRQTYEMSCAIHDMHQTLLQNEKDLKLHQENEETLQNKLSTCEKKLQNAEEDANTLRRRVYELEDSYTLDRKSKSCEIEFGQISSASVPVDSDRAISDDSDVASPSQNHIETANAEESERSESNGNIDRCNNGEPKSHLYSHELSRSSQSTNVYQEFSVMAENASHGNVEHYELLARITELERENEALRSLQMTNEKKNRLVIADLQRMVKREQTLKIQAEQECQRLVSQSLERIAVETQDDQAQSMNLLLLDKISELEGLNATLMKQRDDSKLLESILKEDAAVKREIIRRYIFAHENSSIQKNGESNPWDSKQTKWKQARFGRIETFLQEVMSENVKLREFVNASLNSNSDLSSSEVPNKDLSLSVNEVNTSGSTGTSEQCNGTHTEPNETNLELSQSAATAELDSQSPSLVSVPYQRNTLDSATNTIQNSSSNSLTSSMHALDVPLCDSSACQSDASSSINNEVVLFQADTSRCHSEPSS